MSAPTVDRLTLTAVFEETADGWVDAHVVELPGANTCARTVEDARVLLADAVRELIASQVERETSSAASYEPLDVRLT